jgi:Flp pilus assembly protein TadG
MSAIRARRRLARDDRGVTLVEFAMILPVLVVLLLGIFELGYRSYVASVLQGALHEGARMATVGGITQAQIDARVRTRLRSFAHNATITIRTSSYADYAGVRQPERITQDTEPLNQYNAGDCYDDSNGNSRWDADRGAAGLGNADDIVDYEVTITYRRLFPVGGFLGWGDDETIASNTVLRNQPYAARVNQTVNRCN